MITFGEERKIDWDRVWIGRAKIEYIPPKNPTPYDENTSPIQEQIERLVTNGRGYLPLQEALNIVNRSVPKLDLIDVIKDGLIPINLGPHPLSKIKFEFANPCGEIALGEGFECVLPVYDRTKFTLLEQLKSAQYVAGYVRDCFSSVDRSFSSDAFHRKDMPAYARIKKQTRHSAVLNI